MKITVTSTAVNEKPWEKNGRSGVIRTQEVTAENAKFRNTMRLDLGRSPAFAAGEYTVDLEDNVTMNQYGDLAFARPLKLVSNFKK